MRPCAHRVRVLCGCDSPPIHVSLNWMYGCVDVVVGDCVAQSACRRWTLRSVWPSAAGVRRVCRPLLLASDARVDVVLHCPKYSVEWQIGGRAVETGIHNNC